MIKNKLRELIYKRYNISFSKSGDDIQLKKLINSNKPGTYVDIGCWDPVKASNTYYFYLRAWKGICIDPNPELIELYKLKRPKDIFLNCAVGNFLNKELKYYLLNENFSSMNTLDYNFIKEKQLENQIKKSIDVPVYSLESILEKHLKAEDRLDFFDVDVEGYDLQVLKTNNWDKFRPKFILMETQDSFSACLESEETNYLSTVGYELIAKTIIQGDLGNLYFIDKT